jgi:phosphotransferase system enzyme I (PtsI)
MFRLIGYVVEQFKLAGKPVSVCGEMGGDPLAAASWWDWACAN